MKTRKIKISDFGFISIGNPPIDCRNLPSKKMSTTNQQNVVYYHVQGDSAILKGLEVTRYVLTFYS